ncbi:MAG: hypothetical protein HY904_11595 [Deltaproteobacteria bacterium]|nr:hypothetical protein [Deltaproteobacteria bacterium]
MARRLLFGSVACTAVVVTACIMPVEWTLEPDPVNSPPIINSRVIFLDPALPEVDGVILWDTARNPDLTFTLGAIDDRDVDDTLYVRWLAAYDADVASLDRAVEDTIPPNGEVRRTASFTLTRLRLDEIDNARNSTADGGTVVGRPYAVEVLVGDRRPAFGSAPTDYPDDVQVARWRWVLQRTTTGGN